ncbi:MAG: hypothetical protein AAF993_09290, partial [Pseudomonadota bacterium]
STSFTFRLQPRIRSFVLQDGAESSTVPLGLRFRLEYEGSATHFRVHTSPNFKNGARDVPWISLGDICRDNVCRESYPMANDEPGRKTLYVQIRRDDGPAVDASDDLLYAPEYTDYVLRWREYDSSGEQSGTLQSWLRRAKEAGFETDFSSGTQGGRCMGGGYGVYFAVGANPIYENSGAALGTTCTFELLVGRRLAHGWRIKSAKLRTNPNVIDFEGDILNFRELTEIIKNASVPPGTTCEFSTPPAAGSSEPNFSIRVTYPTFNLLNTSLNDIASADANLFVPVAPCVLDEVVLQGPQAGLWPDTSVANSLCIPEGTVNGIPIPCE